MIAAFCKYHILYRRDNYWRKKRREFALLFFIENQKQKIIHTSYINIRKMEVNKNMNKIDEKFIRNGTFYRRKEENGQMEKKKYKDMTNTEIRQIDFDKEDPFVANLKKVKF